MNGSLTRMNVHSKLCPFTVYFYTLILFWKGCSSSRLSINTFGESHRVIASVIADVSFIMEEQKRERKESKALVDTLIGDCWD